MLKEGHDHHIHHLGAKCSQELGYAYCNVIILLPKLDSQLVCFLNLFNYLLISYIIHNDANQIDYVSHNYYTHGMASAIGD